MKSYKNNNEFFYKTLHPDIEEHRDNINAFNLYNQTRFNSYLKKLGAEEMGELNNKEIRTIENIKSEIQKLMAKYSDTETDRLEFDLAIIIHKNLKMLGWGRWMLDNYNMWRWLSMNHFKEEVFWRRGKTNFKKGLSNKSAKDTYNHLVGTRIRDIFPRRYFIIGERLYDQNNKYKLLEKLADLSRNGKSGGFGNLINNLVDTKLLSPNDYISKMLSEILFTTGKLADDKEVARAFVRYNGFKNRLLNNAGKKILEEEICKL